MTGAAGVWPSAETDAASPRAARSNPFIRETRPHPEAVECAWLFCGSHQVIYHYSNGSFSTSVFKMWLVNFCGSLLAPLIELISFEPTLVPVLIVFPAYCSLSSTIIADAHHVKQRLSSSKFSRRSAASNRGFCHCLAAPVSARIRVDFSRTGFLID